MNSFTGPGLAAVSRFAGMQWARKRSCRGPLILLTALLCGCAAPAAWRNAPLTADENVRYDGRAQLFHAGRAADLLVVASFSGGGSRAAAFASAVVAELDAEPFCWDGRSTSLAQEIDMVTGISGGSIAATHLVLHGVNGHLDRFERDFLLKNFQRSLLGSALSPAGLYRQTSDHYGRGQILADELDAHLFQGRTFGDLAAKPAHPYLIVGATDLATGADFDFTSEQMKLMCSSIDAVPLAFAVAASSSVPLLFSPLTVQNHASACPVARMPLPAVRAEDMPRTRLARAEAEAVTQAKRAYLHLVDGGLSDNLGTRRIVDYVEQAGGIVPLLAQLRRGSAHPGPLTIVFITVNSERLSPHPIDGQSTVPSVLEVLDAMVFGGMGRYSRETALVFSDAVAQWQEQLNAASKGDGSDPPLLHAIDLGLNGLNDPILRDEVLTIPTAFHIQPAQVTALRRAAFQTLQNAPGYRAFRDQATRGRRADCR
ncbi:MAG: patatin-like phospholipase family protein [Burkholderiales bacterium]|nr:patatin-like phospholipase family protein [Burkholderiales bacterium]